MRIYIYTHVDSGIDKCKDRNTARKRDMDIDMEVGRQICIETAMGGDVDIDTDAYIDADVNIGKEKEIQKADSMNGDK